MRESLKILIAKVLTSLTGLVTYATFTKSGISYSTYYGTTSFDISKAGYTPIGLINVSLNQAALHCFSQGISMSGNTATIGVSRYTSGSAVSSLMITISVLYIRSDFVA